MMTAWNTDSGESIYAELLGKALLNMGHQLQVFSFIKDDYHGEGFTGEDEDYVRRCFTVEGYSPAKLDPVPFLTENYEVFVVQDLGMLPKDLLGKIFHRIKKKAKTVNVIHDGKLSENPSFYQFEWDAIVCFDERYRNFLMEAYDPRKVHIIPYPCFPMMKGDKKEKREKLRLPQDKKIILTFCQRGYEPYLRELREELKDKTALLLVIPPGYEILEKEAPPPWMIIREENALSKERFDKYLFASDAAIFHKFESRYHRIVSSVIFQIIGAGCPIFVPMQSEFFRPLQDEVIYYSDMEELNNKLITLFEDGKEAKQVTEAAEVFVRMNSAEKVAERYIELFTKILKERG